MLLLECSTLLVEISNKEIAMGWLKKRFGEASTLAGLGVLFAVGIPLVPPQYQLLAHGIAAALGLGSAVRADPGNK
jgi:hypothetical protein